MTFQGGQEVESVEVLDEPTCRFCGRRDRLMHEEVNLVGDVVEWHCNGYTLTDDRARMDFEAVFGMLSRTYWANDRPRELQREAFEHSTCFNLLHEGRQVGFARAISDFATFVRTCVILAAIASILTASGQWQSLGLRASEGVADQEVDASLDALRAAQEAKDAAKA